jgi:hypothetical protein
MKDSKSQHIPAPDLSRSWPLIVFSNIEAAKFERTDKVEIVVVIDHMAGRSVFQTNKIELGSLIDKASV